MGVILRDFGSGWELVVWEITETEYELRHKVASSDLQDITDICSPERRTGRLAARAALRTIVPDGRVGYDLNGVPSIGGGYVSFSHCRGAAAAIVSSGRCGVDIECADRDFGRAAPRFVTAAERALAGDEGDDFLATVWCAKEALYKYGRRPGTNLLRDIEITAIDRGTGRLTARLRGQEGIEVAVRRIGEFICCHIPGDR